MTPLEAILSGQWNAVFFGWPKPYPDVSMLDDDRNEIDAATDRLHAPDFEVLTPDERGELRNVAKGARAHATAEVAR